MGSGERDAPEATPTDAADHDRDAILSRRARFVAAALAGLAGSAVALACSTESPPAPDAAPQPCLSPLVDGGVPPVDAARDAATPDAADGGSEEPDASDAAPLPCLAPPLDSGGG